MRRSITWAEVPFINDDQSRLFAGIYTYAAPGAAYTPLSNALSPYGIFEGRRFYNQDLSSICLSFEEPALPPTNMAFY